MTTESTKELAAHLVAADQTIGCDHPSCGKAWWRDDSTDDVSLFHDKDCPLFGNRDVMLFDDGSGPMVNVAHLEKEIGRTAGVSSDTREGWRDLAAVYVRLHKDEQEAHFSSVHEMAAALVYPADEDATASQVARDVARRITKARRAGKVSDSTLSLITRILDGGEQATQDTIGALRDESLLFGDDEQPDVADRLRVLAGMP